MKFQQFCPHNRISAYLDLVTELQRGTAWVLFLLKNGKREKYEGKMSPSKINHLFITEAIK